MDWKELIKKARKAIEAGDFDLADQLKASAERLKALDALDVDTGAAEAEAAKAAAELEYKGSVSEKIEKILNYIENEPSFKRAGFVTEDGGTADKNVKTTADFLLAVRRNDHKRLTEVYKTTKDMSSTSGGGGGYLVPDDMRADFMFLEEDTSAILSRVRRVPVATPTGRYPALDRFVAPTAGSGDTAMSGGLTPATVGEGAAYGEDQPTFEMLEWNVSKIGEVVDVPQELVDDSMVSIQALLSSLFRIAINAKLERHVLRGTGAGQPLGILNSAAAIGITPASNNAFGQADALTMYSRFKMIPGIANPVWIMHRGVIPDFVNFTSSAADLVEWRSEVPTSMLGIPIEFSEHSPQDDNAGNVILADLGAYLLFDRQELTIAFSEHAGFKNDLVAWKYNVRVDGMPWMKSTITLADPQGSFTVSPFVYHND